ncbi:MAG: hypothetical protein IKL89_06670 [Clostridia bacterium]|nr:hypothetical protein [Clostridia bacterium]
MKRVAYAIGAGVGGGIIGIFADQLSTPIGANMMVLGVAVLVFCVVKSKSASGK